MSRFCSSLTGFYKIPSLRGVWYRPRLLHDASIVTLEELFDEARLSTDYERKGWSPPGVTKGPIRLEFLTKLPAEDKRALIPFLRVLPSTRPKHGLRCSCCAIRRSVGSRAEAHSGQDPVSSLLSRWGPV